MSLKLLVTGGCGFIGSNFIRYWLSHYPKDFITNIDKLTYAGHLSSTSDFSDNTHYKLIKADILDKKRVEAAMKGIDIVVHFAAESHVDRSIKDPSLFLKTNVIGTQTLLEAAFKNKVQRFHHVSTDEVFGSLKLNTRDKFDEEWRYDPNSPYAASKAASDHIVRAYAQTFGLPISITNCSNNYGPFQDPEKFIPRIITNIIEGKKVPIYGDGKYVRDWLFVEDHCRAIDFVIRKGKNGETYCVGGQMEEVNNFEIAKKILGHFQKDESDIEFVKDRPGHDRRYAIHWTKINKELGWKPQHDFDEWLAETITWYKENKRWWQPLKRRAEKLYSK